MFQWLFRRKRIRLTHRQDLAFARIAQGALVTGSTLPSGLQVPNTDYWYVENKQIVHRPKG